jgi:hypothetical protein
LFSAHTSFHGNNCPVPALPAQGCPERPVVIIQENLSSIR